MEKRCILFTGLQASGKSTFYRERFSDLTHVNLDTLHTRNRERRLIDECFAAGASFVVDNTNPTRQVRRRYIEAAGEQGYRVIGYYFQSSISACKERNSRRTGKALLPVSALAQTHRILEIPDWDEGYDELYYVRIEGDRFVVEPWKEKEEIGRF
ncbi:MAG: ATP-binding protein [Clostridia bacterium]|nr:ATP-binding protein [Clostridia bacterium]